MKRNKQVLAVTLATSLVVGSLGGGQMTVQAETGAQNATIELTDADVAELSGVTSVTRTSVHDPSIVKDGDTYYVFGSHMGVSKSTDLQNWTSVTGESTTSSLFGVEEDGVATAVSYEQAFLENAYTGKVTALVNGEEVEVDFGENYDIAAWISSNTIQGNMWAPDVIYNPTMDKWCMYQSLNGAKWNSAVVLLTADDIEGPYVYQGPVVFSGFSTADSTKSFKDTDLEIVIGEKEELPGKYQKISDDSWGTYWPHAIDPAAFFDDEGDLWLTYGSWSGGIYMLELDENTGLRDYTVSYESDFDTLGASVTSDEYFGTKIAGGYYVSGEGPYIEKIEDYYYLFMSYGFYSPEGGYNMRVFRSENPDGPYVDANGVSAIYQRYVHNYNAIDKYNNYGVKLMGNYQWDTMKKAEVAQGHNSAFVDDDGKAYVVYHTKFNDGTAGHEVRVHQLYVNSQGWLVASPYEYSGETISATGYSAEEIAGTYGMITHEYQINFGDLEYQSPETIVLNADGTVSGAYTGTWSTTAGSADAILVLDGKTYYGMFTEEVIDGTTIETMGFTFVSEDGLSIWGTKELGDSIAVAQTVTAGVQIPTVVYESFTVPTEGQSDAKIAWTSSNEAVISTTGAVTRQNDDTPVTMTATIYKGDYFYQKEFSVLVKAAVENDTEKVIATYLTGESKNLSTGLDQSISIPNPFYKDVTAVDLSGGVTVAFDAVATGDVHVLGTIFSFLGDGGANGRLYFTPGSYLGYNANGGYFDANLLNYGLVTDYIGESAHVEINIHDAGFTVTVDGEVAYTEEILTTENGAGTVTNYATVLNWLQNSADTLYFGYGSWWNAAGFDEANVEISNVEFKVGAAKEASTDDEVPAKTSASYTKDEVVLASNDSITVEENPFYGVFAEKIELAYTVNFTEGTAQNGWDGIFSFYNSTTGGRVSVHTAPYVCYNDQAGNWMDINQPGLTGGSNMAPSAVPGQDYDVVITITADGMKATVDGEEVSLGIAGSGAGYDDLLAFIGECDQLTWGVGLAQTAYWNTELCKVTDIEFKAGKNIKPTEYVKDEVVLESNNAITIEDSPLYGVEVGNVQLAYTINFTEGTAQNGWDGIFSFYNSTTGGRVSVHTAPFVCYNDQAGNWMDINQPGLTGGSNMAPSAVPGQDYDVVITITADGMKATVDGEEVSLGIAGSGAGYDDLLAFIGECDQLTWGVGLAQTAYWNTEICTLTDIEIVANADFSVVETPDEDESKDDDTTDDDSTGRPEKPEEFADATYEKTEVVLASNDAMTVEDSPFYGIDTDKVKLEYTITFAEGSAHNGFDGIFSFYNSETTGRVSIHTAPYVCYNDAKGNWMDINHPESTNGSNMATNATIGDAYKVTILITEDGVEATVNGEAVALGLAGSGAGYDELLEFIGDCDQLTWGVGQAKTSYWFTELCTLTDVKFTAGNDVTDVIPDDDVPGAETPEVDPSETPEVDPSETPEVDPSETPEVDPSETPEVDPSETPEVDPSETPEVDPSETPEVDPSETPEVDPSETPEVDPSETPEVDPSETPEVDPSETPEVDPSETPEVDPSETPEVDPSETPEVDPSETPEVDPSETPEVDPSETPEVDPSETPEVDPSETPEVDPSETPEVDPSETPEVDPSETPEVDPSEPSKEPEKKPSSSSNQSNNNNSNNNNSNNQSQPSSKPVVKPVEIVEIIEEIVPKASSIEKVGFDYIDIKLNQKNAKLKKEFLAKYYGRNTQLMVHLGNKIGFSIDTAQLSANQSELQLGATVKTLDNFAEGFVTMHIQPTKAAALNQMIGIHLKVGEEYVGKTAFIYTRDLTTNTIEFQYAATVNEIGNVTLLSDELTDVVVMIQE